MVEPTVTFQMQSVNRLLACFFSGSLLETAPTPATRLNYELLHFSLIFFLGAWAFSLWGKGAVNRMRRHGILDRHLNVFWGVNKQGIALAKDILANNAIAQVEFNIPSTVFDADEGDAEVRRLDGLDALWMSVDFNRLSRGLTKGSAHYFLSGSGEENMLLADTLARFLPESESGAKKTFYIRIESSADEQMFADWSETLKSRVDIALVREAEMIARQLVHEYPILKACPGVSFDSESVSVSGGVCMLVIGFDAVGWDIVEQMICNTRFSTSTGSELPFACTVIDSDSCGWEEFRAYCPDAETCYNLRFEKRDLAAPDFPDWVAQQLGMFNRIVVCSADSGTNVELLSRIEKAARNALKDRLFDGDVLPRVFVRVANAETKNCVEAVRRQRTEAGHWLYGVTRFFGCLEDIYRTDFLNYDTLYDVASVLNARHMNNGNLPQVGNGWLCRSKARERRVIDAFWVRASFDDRMSSLSSAAGERNALKLMGYSVVEKLGGKSNVGGDLEALRRRLANENTLDRLARNEHYRWNAWHRMRGYRTWDLVNPPIDDEKDKKANKLSAFGRHADIVAYDDLPEVDRRIQQAISPEDAERAFPEQFKGDGSYAVRGEKRRCAQYWDREFCRSIADHIAAAGCTVVSASSCAGSNVGRAGKGEYDAN